MGVPTQNQHRINKRQPKQTQQPTSSFSTSTQKLQKTTKAHTTTNKFLHKIHTESTKDNQSTNHNQQVPIQNPHRINKRQPKQTQQPTSSFTKSTQNSHKTTKAHTTTNQCFLHIHTKITKDNESTHHNIKFLHKIHTESTKDNQSKHNNQPVLSPNLYRIYKRQPKHTPQPTSSYTKSTQNQQTTTKAYITTNQFLHKIHTESTNNNKSIHQNQQVL